MSFHPPLRRCSREKAVLAVSFGTTVSGEDEACIRPIEDRLREAFPDHEIRRAFTSRGILGKLAQKGVFIENETDAIVRLRREGFEEITVVPTTVIPGGEYEKIRAASSGCRLSEPLLCCADDLCWLSGLLSGIIAQEERPVLLMGHGTDHAADGIYAQLQKALPPDAFLACLHGGISLESILPDLDRIPGRQLTLMPLMLVAGRHAREHLAGSGSDSWKRILEAWGFQAHVRMQGLGALEAVRSRFAEKAAHAKLNI